MMTSSSSSAHAQAVQWGNEETRDLIVIRGEAERDLVGIKRNKTIWEIVSVKLRERGYSRTSDQCKCKWKNLVNRYKVNSKLPSFQILFYFIFYQFLFFLIVKNFINVSEIEKLVGGCINSIGNISWS